MIQTRWYSSSSARGDMNKSETIINDREIVRSNIANSKMVLRAIFNALDPVNSVLSETFSLRREKTILSKGLLDPVES